MLKFGKNHWKKESDTEEERKIAGDNEGEMRGKRNGIRCKLRHVRTEQLIVDSVTIQL